MQDLKEIDPTHYEAVFETKVAYMKFRFNVTVEVTRMEAPSVIEAKIEGTPLGVVGRLTAKSTTMLTEAGDETKVVYSVESTLAGKLGSIGQPVLRSKAKDMEKQFAKRLRAHFAPAARRIDDPIRLAEPKSLAEAIKLLDPDDATVRPIAGGTALMLMMKAGVFRPARLVSLRKIEKKYFSIGGGGDGLRIGAMTTLSALERSADVRKHAPLITRTLLTLSNVRVRNVATVGGALAHGDPHMDLPPVLMALGATMTIAGPAGERKLAVEDLFAGYYETVLDKNELIAEVHVPSQGKKRAAYLKVTTGSADDWPALGVAVVIEADGGSIKSARIVASAATDKATRLKAAEAVLAGARIDDKMLTRPADAAAEEAEYIADVRGSVSYKRELMRVYVGRAVRSRLASKRSRTDGHTITMRRRRPAPQVGRSVPRLEGARQGHRPRRIHPHHAPARHAARQRSSAARSRTAASNRSTRQRGEEMPGRLSRRHHRRRAQGHPRSLLRPGVPRSADPGAIDKVRFVGEPVAVVLAADPHVAEAGGAAHRRRIRGVAGGVRRGRGADFSRARPWRAAAGRHVRRPQASQRPQGHQRRARLPPAPRRRRQGLRPAPRMCSSTSSARRRCCTCRSSRTPRSPTTRTPASRSIPPRRPLVRAHRDRPAARLAGEQGAHQGAVSRRRAMAPSSTSSSRRWRSRSR